MQTTLETYLATLAPMPRARARAALARNMRLNGVIVWRWLAAETLAANSTIRIDRARGRVYTSQTTFYEIADLTKSAVDYIAWLKAPFGEVPA